MTRAFWEEVTLSPDAPEDVRADELFRFLMFGAADIADPDQLLSGFSSRLSDAGLDLLRVNMQMRPLSPQVAALLYVWRPLSEVIELSSHPNVLVQDRRRHQGGGVQVTTLAHGVFLSPSYLASPFYRLLALGEQEVRRRIVPGQTSYEFPILQDLAVEEATDYLALTIPFRGTATCGISFVTTRAGGFTDRQITLVRRAVVAFAQAMSPFIAAYTTRSLLGAYLGQKTGERVLLGKVELGDVEEIEAAVWFSDLRGFTPMSRGVPSRELIAWLNEYFSAVARAIARHDGEILKFIGDAILAVWPVSATYSREDACRAAIAAARDANTELDALNANRATRGLPPMQHGIGLHVGPVQYGNIGAEGRLDFTVIGPAVNLASRIESACAKLARRAIASRDVAACAGEELAPLGVVELKGIVESVPLFGIA